MRTHWETVWEFSTARYRVALEIAPEDSDPADSFDDAEAIAEIRNDLCAWFVARVAVYHRESGLRLGEDYLGGCAYRDVREFYESHRDPDPLNRNCSIMRATCGHNVCIGHYFPDMVVNAVSEARKTLEQMASAGELLRKSAVNGVLAGA